MLDTYRERGDGGLVKATPEGGKGSNWAHSALSGERLYRRHGDPENIRVPFVPATL
jgi:hypothetical protein